MIEAQASTHIPASHVNPILHVGRGLDVPSAIRELELLLGSRIELCRVCDGVLEGLADPSDGSVNAPFPVVMAVMPPEVRAEVTLAGATVLTEDDGRVGLVCRQT